MTSGYALMYTAAKDARMWISGFLDCRPQENVRTAPANTGEWSESHRALQIHKNTEVLPYLIDTISMLHHRHHEVHRSGKLAEHLILQEEKARS